MTVDGALEVGELAASLCLRKSESGELASQLTAAIPRGLHERTAECCALHPIRLRICEIAPASDDTLMPQGGLHASSEPELKGSEALLRGGLQPLSFKVP